MKDWRLSRGKIAEFFQMVWLPVLIGCFGLLPMVSKGMFVGDIGDARFIMYVLEHGFKAMHHHFRGFWEAPFYFPHRNIIAYSENCLGGLPIYSVFRGLNFSREEAYQCWTLVNLALTYFSGYLALRSFGARRLAAGLAAYIFTFGLPIQGQMSHFQLLPRFLVPWMFVCASRLVATGRTRDFAWIAVLMLGQMYLGVYGGVLAGITLAAYLLALLIFGNWREGVRHIAGSGWTMAIRAAILLLAGLALLPIAIPYQHAAKELGMRPWPEIAAMIPRINSWLHPAELTILWRWLFSVEFLGLRNLPLEHEHRNFVGITMLLSLLAWPFLKTPEGRLSYLAGRAWWAVLFCFIMTLSVWDWTLWRLLAVLPGVGAIRGVTRIVLFMLFPMAMVLAAVLGQLTEWARARCSGTWDGEAKLAALGCLLAALVFVDNGVSSVPKLSFAESSAGAKQIAVSLRGLKPRKNYAFWVSQSAPGDPYWKTQLDAMLASQDAGIATLNGYTGWYPPGYGLWPVQSSEEPEFYRIKEWLDAHKTPQNLKIVVIGKNGRMNWYPAPDYSLGTLMQFTQARAEGGLGKGFSGTEKDGVWTNGKWASLSLHLRDFSKRDLNLALSLTTCPPPAGRENTLRLKVNGTEIATRPANKEESFVWKLEVPRDVAARKAGNLEIEIGSDRVFPMKNCFPNSVDPRSVGVFVKTLSIE